MTWTPDLSVFTEAFSQTAVAGWFWAIPLIITFLSMLLITRDVEKWKILFLPVWSGWWIVGVRGNTLMEGLIFVAGAVLLVIEMFSTQVLGNFIQTLRKAGSPQEAIREFRRSRELKRMEKESNRNQTILKYQKLLERINKFNEGKR